MLESVITLSVFYLFYLLFLQKETFFKLNRAYLISTLIFSVTVPFIHLDWMFFTETLSTNQMLGKISLLKQGYVELNEVVIRASSGESVWISLAEYAGIFYLSGVALTIIFFIIGFSQTIHIIWKSTPKVYGRYRIVESSKVPVPFSLFRWIIINPEKHTSYDMEKIIVHEKMHAFQLHSIDLIIIEVLVILFWFNPFIYWYRKSIREVHEYLADQAVVENGYDRIDYQRLLLSQVTGSRFIGLTSRFSYSLSKNRLKMLTNMKSKKSSKIKIALIIPFITAVTFFFACHEDSSGSANELEEVVVTTSKDEGQQNTSSDKVEGKIYIDPEVMPKFNGQEPDAFRMFIAKNLKYPEEAKKNNNEGRVFVSFVVDVNGNVEDVKVVRGVSPALDYESLRVVKSSPKWDPGLQDGEPVNVAFTFPIFFKLK